MLNKITSRERRMLRDIFGTTPKVELVRPFVVLVEFDQLQDITPIIDANTGSLRTDKDKLYQFANLNSCALILSNATIDPDFSAGLNIVKRSHDHEEFKLIQDPPHRDQYLVDEQPVSLALFKDFEDARDVPTSYTTAAHTRDAMQRMLKAESSTLHPLVIAEMEKQMDASFTFSLTQAEIASRNIILDYDQSFTNRLRSYYEDDKIYDHQWPAHTYQVAINPNSWTQGENSLLHFRMASNEASTIRVKNIALG